MRLPESIAATLELGGTIVTSSARSARALRRLHGEMQHALGRRAWRAASIFDWDGWLERQWRQNLQRGAERRLLLTALQEHYIWGQIVKPGIEGLRLISVDGVAELAQQAYTLLCTYESLDFLQGNILGGVDVESFREWGREFERKCAKEGWLSRSMLPLTLRGSLLARRPALSGKILLTGFDRIPPAAQSLMATCEALGHAVEWEGAGERASRRTLVEAIDTQDEITTCAWWARHLLHATAVKNTPLRVGILVPNVEAVRGEMERIFRGILAPQTTPVSERELPVPFEFSLGVPLADVPMLRAALLLLRWMEEAIRQEELTWLMLSGFLWRERDELLPVAAFDARRRSGSVLPPEQELEAYLSQRGWGRNQALAGLHARLRSARIAWRAAAGTTRSFAVWTEHAEKILAAAGWPGAHRLESEGFQALNKWTQLLDSIALLGFDGSRVRYPEFLRALERQARQTIFAPESSNAPVQILGPLEAAGLRFDAVWFLGVDDASWPAPARPHPFLTPSLQKQRAMPHANTDADWQLAKLATERIDRSATSCVFSYPRQNHEGRCRPSTVLSAAAFPFETISAVEMQERIRALGINVQDERSYPALPLEEEEAAIVPWPTEREAGGYNTLKMQAACAFQAFATIRLGARELNRNDWGLDAAERGKVLHRVMQNLWEELKNRDALIATRHAGRLRDIVEHHVDAALAAYGNPPGERQNNLPSEKQQWSRAYLEAERERVSDLVEAWLAYEEQRTPFTVERCEQMLPAQVGNLRLRLRTDRIDAVEGGQLLLDYKTGKASAAAWEGSRPDEPQLPLYAAYGNVEALRGVLLAQIRAGDLKFEGRVDDAAVLWPGQNRRSKTPYSAEMQQQWKEILLALGEQFLNGEAQVDPKHYPKTCELCPLPGLCRVAEMRRDAGEEEETGSSGAAG